MLHDFKNWMRVIQWVDPDAHASGVGIEDVDTPIDTLGWRYLVTVVNVGDSAGTWLLQLESSDATGGTYVDVTGALFTVGLTSDDTRLVGVVDLQGSAAGMNRWYQFAAADALVAAIDMGITAILVNPINSVELIDFSSGGADELEFEV